MPQPSNQEILEAIREIHGDVRVALDRTENQDGRLNKLSDRVDGHGLDIARAKGNAASFGALASIAIVFVIEYLKSVFSKGSAT